MVRGGFNRSSLTKNALVLIILLAFMVPALPTLGSNPAMAQATHGAKTTTLVATTPIPSSAMIHSAEVERSFSTLLGVQGMDGPATPYSPAAETTPAHPLSGVLHVADTLDLCNNSLVPGNFMADNCDGVDPYALSYDSGNGEVYVADYSSGHVSAISDSTNNVVASVPVVSYPLGMAYDSGKGEIFVASTDCVFICNGNSNVSAISDLTNTVAATIQVGKWANGVAYDSGKGEVFVTNFYSTTVSVIDDSNNHVVANITVGEYARGIAYDSGMSEVFVVNQDSNTVTIISDTTNGVVTTVPVGTTPEAVAYDSGKGEVFVANTLSNNVSVISDTTNKVVANIPVSSEPQGLAYDNGKGEVLVVNDGSNNVSAINDTTGKVVATIPTGSSPVGAAYDSGMNEVFVANELSGNVSAINDATDTVTATIMVGTGPVGMAYDPGDNDVLVANDDSDNVSVISDAIDRVTATVPVGPAPAALTYDSGKGEVFVTNSYCNFICVGGGGACMPSYGSVSVIDVSTKSVVKTIRVGCNPQGVAFDSGMGEVLVANTLSNNVSVINDTTDKVVATVATGLFSEAVAYDSGKGEIFVANPGSDNVSVISDTTDKVVASVRVGTYPTSVTYDSAFGEVFVANADSNNVSVISDGTNTVAASIAVGTYPACVAYDGGTGEIFVANRGSGNVSVISGSSNTVTSTLVVGYYPAGIAVDESNGLVYVSNFDQGTISMISMGPPPPTFTVTFTESGLPLGTSWSVTLGGVQNTSLTNSMTFAKPNGTYPWVVAALSGYQANTTYGNITVNGANVSVLISWSPTYLVTFTESGLPSGTSWSVTLNGSLRSSTTSSIIFSEPNGTYAWTLTAISGYHANIYFGNITVSGTGSTVPISWSQVTYSVSFTEIGLPPGTEWWVNVTGGPSNSSTTTTLSLNEPNGTYHYSLASVNKEFASQGGSFTVSGATLSKTVTFSLVMYTVKFTETGLPTGTNWTVSIGGTPRYSTGSTIMFVEANGTYLYSVMPVANFTTTYNGQVIVNGNNPSVEVVFVPFTYAVTFTEIGLPLGTEWYLNITGQSPITSVTTTASINLANGTYPSTIESSNKLYRPVLHSFNFTVTGGTLNRTVFFNPQVYLVSFTETGLPSGVEWYLNITGQTPVTSVTTIATTILSNGSYSYTIATADKQYAPSLASSGFSVAGLDVSEPVTFLMQAYTVTFTENGLPLGTNLTVTLDGVMKSNAAGVVPFMEPNGTYSFTVGNVSGYASNLTSGKVTVRGEAVTEALSFVRIIHEQYVVRFTEVGLPSGSSWSVTLNGVDHVSTNGTVSFNEVNGTYAFIVGAVNGYSASPGSGAITVAGAIVSRVITFTPSPMGRYIVEFNESGLPLGTNWSVTLNGAQQYTTGTTITFTETNRTYSYTVGQVGGYTASPSSGDVTVNGNTVTVSISFSPTSSTSTGFLGLPGDLGYVVIGVIAAVVVVMVVLLLMRRKPEPSGESKAEEKSDDSTTPEAKGDSPPKAEP